MVTGQTIFLIIIPLKHFVIYKFLYFNSNINSVELISNKTIIFFPAKYVPSVYSAMNKMRCTLRVLLKQSEDEMYQAISTLRVLLKQSKIPPYIHDDELICFTVISTWEFINISCLHHCLYHEYSCQSILTL
jgi:hypothetical protein